MLRGLDIKTKVVVVTTRRIDRFLDRLQQDVLIVLTINCHKTLRSKSRGRDQQDESRRHYESVLFLLFVVTTRRAPSINRSRAYIVVIVVTASLLQESIVPSVRFDT